MHFARNVILIVVAFILPALLIPQKPTLAQTACMQGDANSDGKVTLTDFAVWRSVYLSQLSPTMAQPTQPPQTTCPTGSVTVNPGQNLQQVVDAQPTTAVICLKAGLYREQSIAPKTGMTIVGEGDTTILNGSRLLSEFQQEGSLWFATGQTQEGEVHGECDNGIRCERPEDLYINDQNQIHVPTKAQVGPGKWFFDYSADRIYLGDNPTSKKIETSTVRHAIHGEGTSNITVKNLLVEKYANPTQFGAIQNGGFGYANGDNWMIDNVTVRLTHGTGIGIFGGTGNTVQNSRANNNGQKGIGASGTNTKILNNEMAYNNYQEGVSSGWEAGGSKFSSTNGLLVKDNYVHHNFGPGLWTDIDNVNTIHEHNLVTDNKKEGIFHEISYKATIKNNTVLRNGFAGAGWCYGAGILVSASKDVEIFGNIVQGNYHSIMGLQQQRGSGSLGPYEVQNMNVHDNHIEGGSAHRAQTGVCADYQTGIDTTWNNHFENNKYYGTGLSWAWSAQELTTFAQWQAFGNDDAGTYSSGQSIPDSLFMKR